MRAAMMKGNQKSILAHGGSSQIPVFSNSFQTRKYIGVVRDNVSQGRLGLSAINGRSHERYQKWTIGAKKMRPPKQKLRLIQNLFLIHSQKPMPHEMRKSSMQILLPVSLEKCSNSTMN